MGYDIAQIDAFSVGDVLTAFGLPAPARGPCPLCLTSPASQAFSWQGVFWSCFACGRKGNQIGLYAALGGTSYGTAIRAIAGTLGLGPVEPSALEAARSARETESQARARADRSASIRFRVAAWKRDYLSEIARRARIYSPAALDVLETLYRELGEAEAVVLREYPAKGWA